MAKIRLENISKIYENGIQAIKDYNLTINDGEFVVLVGPSGCGKTTLLRMIAGLEEITSGELTIHGELANDKEPKDRNIAMVFQSYALYPHLTVYDNMAFSLTLKKENKKVIEEKVRTAAKMLDLDSLLERKPAELSGGQRQRVALGRAIVRDPDIFLMDEPLSNLDAKLRVQMRSEIIRLHDDLKTNFIYVTHDQTEAMTMGDKIVVMKDGNIMQVGTPYDIYNHPENIFVAEFFGSPTINILDSELLKNQPNIEAHKIPDGLIGIRPENVKLISGEELHITHIENLGAEKLMFLEANTHPIRTIAPKTQHFDLETPLSMRILDYDELVVFDRETKKSIS